MRYTPRGSRRVKEPRGRSYFRRKVSVSSFGTSATEERNVLKPSAVFDDV
jgi:hypothetical protein